MADRNQLMQYFQHVDKDRTGQINSVELGQALSNGTHQPFNPTTTKLMISMFDTQNKGSVNFDEFCNLWAYVNQWQTTFHKYDRDRSGFIDQNELQTAITSFGYRFSPPFYAMLVQKFGQKRPGQVAFDDFIQACIMIQALTGEFQKFDHQRSGSITVTYEQFMTMIFKTTPV